MRDRVEITFGGRRRVTTTVLVWPGVVITWMCVTGLAAVVCVGVWALTVWTGAGAGAVAVLTTGVFAGVVVVANRAPAPTAFEPEC